jgi:hypothetical protein
MYMFVLYTLPHHCISTKFEMTVKDLPGNPYVFTFDIPKKCSKTPKITSCKRLIIDEVWIGDWIY